MATCTFFGHRDTPKAAEPILQSTLTDLIENENVSLFYVGNQGNFDKMVISNLRLLKQKYPHIRYCIVLAYIPDKNKQEDYENTIYPEGIEYVPYKYAINERNCWMISKSDFAITYVNSAGNSSKFSEIAERKGLIVINLAEKVFD